MSVHAVHAAAERNVCYIVVSAETPQTTTNPSQTLLPVYKLTPAPLSPHLQHQNFRCSHTQSMDVDKDKTTI